MSVLEDYAKIRGTLNSAIQNGLRDNVADGLKKAIQSEAKDKVYSYQATPSAMNRRRKDNGGLIDDVTMLTSVDGLTLTLENTAEPQHASGIPLTPIVEGGWSRWHQPGPREFMDQACGKYVDNGGADSDLADALRGAGFEVI